MWLLAGERGASEEHQRYFQSGQGSVGLAGHTGLPQPPSPEPGQMEIAHPVKIDGETVAVLRLQRAQGPHFTDEEFQVGAALSDLLAVALRGGQAEDRIASFLEFSQFPYSAVSLDQIPGRILARARAMFPSVSGWISVVDSMEGDLRVRAAAGLAEEQIDPTWLGADELESVEPDIPGIWTVRRSDPAMDSSWPTEQAETAVVAEMATHAGQVGRIVLLMGPEQEFSAQQKLLFSTLATQAAAVVQSAGLFVAVQELAVQEERSRIAREIHDGVAQNLALLMLRVEIISRVADKDPGRVREELAKVSSVLEASVHELRRSIYTLQSPDIARLGLIRALQRLARNYGEQTSILVRLAFPSALPAGPQAQSAIYSIVQERLDVIARQGAATVVSVSVVSEDDMIGVTIKDNGPRSTSAVRNGRTLAPWQARLQEKASSLGWKLTVSFKRSETKIQVHIPSGVASPSDR